jgi:plasmid stability protein
VKNLTVRNLPDELYARLTRLARLNRRSLQQQALVLLERARVDDPEGPVERAAAIRARLAGRALGDTVAEVRQERAR